MMGVWKGESMGYEASLSIVSVKSITIGAAQTYPSVRLDGKFHIPR
jgi:hypothetical protein